MLLVHESKAVRNAICKALASLDEYATLQESCAAIIDASGGKGPGAGAHDPKCPLCAALCLGIAPQDLVILHWAYGAHGLSALLKRCDPKKHSLLGFGFAALAHALERSSHERMDMFDVLDDSVGHIRAAMLIVASCANAIADEIRLSHWADRRGSPGKDKGFVISAHRMSTEIDAFVDSREPVLRSALTLLTAAKPSMCSKALLEITSLKVPSLYSGLINHSMAALVLSREKPKRPAEGTSAGGSPTFGLTDALRFDRAVQRRGHTSGCEGTTISLIPEVREFFTTALELTQSQLDEVRFVCRAPMWEDRGDQLI